MFASLKKKIEEGATPVATNRNSSVSGSPSGIASRVPSSSSYIHGEDTPVRAGSAKRTSVSSDLRPTKQNESTATASVSQVDDASKDIAGSKEELMELLMKRTRQIKTMETKYQDLTSVLKEKTAMIEKLESALEKQQDVHCQRVHELNERYNSCRAKLAETVAIAVRRKEEEMKQQFKDLEQSRQEHEEKVRQFEAFKDKMTERQDTNDELEAFATQELTKVKHLFLNAEEEIQRLKTEKQTMSTDAPSGSSDIIRGLYDQIAELKNNRSELEAKNVELCESVASLKVTSDSLKSQLQDSKDSLANMAGSQDEWLEKQIESERSISTLEQQMRSLKTELAQSETFKASLVKQLDERTAEIANLKSALETLKLQCDSQQSTVDKHSSVVAELEKCRQQATDECERLERELSELMSRHETARNEFETFRSTSETELKSKQETIDSLEERMQRLQDECSALQQRLDELEQLHSSIAADVEANTTAKFQQEISSLEDQLLDKNRLLKKQDQRMSDLKKLLQRELRVQAPPNGDVIFSAASGPPLPPSGMSSSHLYLDSLPSAPAPPPSAFIPSVHTSAVHHSASSPTSSLLGNSLEPSSPATISVSDVPYHNGQHDNYLPSSVAGLPLFHAEEINKMRSGRRTSGRGTAGGHGSSSAVMCASDSEYDFMRELNFTYLRHVVLKFMLSREAEAMQLIKAVSMLLHFTPEEQKLIHDTLEWKMSWFGSRPPLPAKGQTAKIIPPSY